MSECISHPNHSGGECMDCKVEELEARELGFIQSMREMEAQLAEQVELADNALFVAKELEAELQALRRKKAEQYQLAQYYRSVLQEIRDKTPAGQHGEWPHHHWYLVTASDAINHKLLEGDK